MFQKNFLVQPHTLLTAAVGVVVLTQPVLVVEIWWSVVLRLPTFGSLWWIGVSHLLIHSAGTN